VELAGDFRVFRHSVRPNSCDVCLHELSYLGLHHFSGSCPKSVISVRGAAATARSSDRWPR
jgi:hypothetical protein